MLRAAVVITILLGEYLVRRGSQALNSLAGGAILVLALDPTDLFRSVPQRDRSGKIVKWYGNSMDIDDRKRAEETLRDTETRFRTYIDHATDAFFVLDLERGTILDVNRRACENLGYTREELLGAMRKAGVPAAPVRSWIRTKSVR